MYSLEMMNTASKGKIIQVSSELLIGTAAECQLRAQHENLKPVHARFTVTNNSFEVEAGEAEARIYVNRADVLHSELKHNDVLKIGPLRLKVIDQRYIRRTTDRLDELLHAAEDPDTVEVHDFAKEDLFYLTNKNPALRERISFRMPSRDRFIDQAQQFLARIIKQSGMDEMKVEAFMTCTKELILNAHRHGHKYDESKQITIQYSDDGEAITVTIEDEGDGFDHRTAVEAVTNKSAADAARERYKAGGFGGLGFQMIVRMADKLTYNDAGNVVTFTVKKDF